MKCALQIVAVMILGLAFAFWLVGGANRGWTRTSVEIKRVDKVTGLDHIEWKSAFVPGIDLLALATVAAAVLVAASFLFPKRDWKLKLKGVERRDP